MTCSQSEQGQADFQEIQERKNFLKKEVFFGFFFPLQSDRRRWLRLLSEALCCCRNTSRFPPHYLMDGRLSSVKPPQPPGVPRISSPAQSDASLWQQDHKHVKTLPSEPSHLVDSCFVVAPDNNLASPIKSNTQLSWFNLRAFWEMEFRIPQNKFRHIFRIYDKSILWTP